MARYKVQVSNHHSEIVNATTGLRAKAKVWNSIKKGYTYGWNSWKHFTAGVTATKM
jgi:hypothetical protein